MADTTYNLPAGRKADRKLEMIFVNCGSHDTPDWEIQGRGVEDASVSYNHEVNQVTDILGITDTDVSPAKPELDLEPNNLRGGQKLTAKLLDIERRNAISELSEFEVLHVHCFVGQAGAFQAELHSGCTIVPQGIGGASYVGMPINIYLSNDKTLGTVAIADGVPTFTAQASA